MKNRVEERWTYQLMSRLGKKICRRNFLIYILNLTWGLLLNIIGGLTLLILLPFGKVERYKGYIFLRFKHNSRSNINIYQNFGFNLGLFSFVTIYSRESLLDHELGHCIQNAILGPLTIFLVHIPSTIRYHYRNWVEKRGNDLDSQYDDIWFEASATEIGYYMGKPHNYLDDYMPRFV